MKNSANFQLKILIFFSFFWFRKKKKIKMQMGCSSSPLFTSRTLRELPEEECSHLLSSEETVEGFWFCPARVSMAGKDEDVEEFLNFFSDGSLSLQSPFGLTKGKWLFENLQEGEKELKIYLMAGQLGEKMVRWSLVRKGVFGCWLCLDGAFFRKEDQSCFDYNPKPTKH